VVSFLDTPIIVNNTLQGVQAIFVNVM